eukprot:3975053-Amphidinium_carterae.2
MYSSRVPESNPHEEERHLPTCCRADDNTAGTLCLHVASCAAILHWVSGHVCPPLPDCNAAAGGFALLLATYSSYRGAFIELS